ncbi:MAG: adenylate/guanylate cyclase domain-containing protein [Dehalococcoidia bacterium]
MEPSIQYAKTKDGVSIAFSTLGEGMPFVYVPQPPLGNIESIRRFPEARRWYERLAEKRQLVLYDSRGGGLSERNVTDFSLDALTLDLEAVVTALELEQFALFGYGDSGLPAVAYAARHPGQVSHLILWCSLARPSDQMQVSEEQGFLALLEKDWRLFTETISHVFLGRSGAKMARRMAEHVQNATTPEVMLAFWEAVLEVDVTDLLPKIKSPTLVLHRRGIRGMTADASPGLASQIPNARLLVFEGDSLVPFVGDMESVASAIEEFLDEGKEDATDTPELPEGMAVILFADIVESTALTEQLGDAAFRAKARELDTSLRLVIRECSGTPVEGKLVGDGVLAVFTSARQAIDCALRCDANSEPLGLQLHLGIHAGDVIREGNNVYGGAVNIAARIAGASAPGEVLVSDTVRGLARTSAGVAFDDRGEHSLKGVADPQRLFAVRGGG